MSTEDSKTIMPDDNELQHFIAWVHAMYLSKSTQESRFDLKCLTASLICRTTTIRIPPILLLETLRAMTTVELASALSSTNIDHRAALSTGLWSRVVSMKHSDPLTVIKAFELFKVSVHNVDKLEPRDPLLKRNLFLHAEFALNVLHDCCSARLSRQTGHIDVFRLEVADMNTDTTFKSNPAGLRYAAVHKNWLRTCRTSHEDVATSLKFEETFRILLGEEMSYELGGAKPRMTELDSVAGPDVLLEEKSKWDTLMMEFAVSILITMATKMSEKFGGQGVEVFGTRFPSKVFE